MTGTLAWVWSTRHSTISGAVSTSCGHVNLQTLFERHLLFVGGKGGVGKTTTAAALALAAAKRGRTTLVVSTDPAHSLGDIFNQSIGNQETALAERLWGLEIDPDAEAERHISTVKEQMKKLVHARLFDEIDRQLDLARYAPGASEAALLERIAALMGQEGVHRDLVIFDTAPSGHTVRLLSLPEIMGAWTDGLLRHRDRSSRLTTALKTLGGGRSKGDDLSMIDAAEDHTTDSMAGQVNEVLQARRRRFLVARDRLVDTTVTAFLLVLNPDKLSILESRKVMDLLGRFRMEVSGLIVNRVLPAAAIPSSEAGATDSFWVDRGAQEQSYLAEINTAFGTIPRVIVPLLRRDICGTAQLREVGDVLAGEWSRP